MGRKTAAALLAASALLVAACGDDGDTETGGEDVEEPGATEDTRADDEGEAAGRSGDFCDEYAHFSRDWGISDIHDDPDGYGAALRELEAAPEIAEDVQTLEDNIEVVAETLGTTADDSDQSSESHDHSGHGSEAHDDLAHAMDEQELQQMIQEVKDANDAITGWVENNCPT